MYPSQQSPTIQPLAMYRFFNLYMTVYLSSKLCHFYNFKQNKTCICEIQTFDFWDIPAMHNYFIMKIFVKFTNIYTYNTISPILNQNFADFFFYCYFHFLDFLFFVCNTSQNFDSESSNKWEIVRVNITYKLYLIKPFSSII